MGELEGKVALVLGAGTAGNMGQAIAARFAAEGARVMVAGRDSAELARFAATIGAGFRRCDITSEADLKALTAETLATLGGLDIAVNTSGINHVMPFLEVPREDLQRVIDVQLIGTFQFLQSVLAGISDGGSVIHISSLTASKFMPDHAIYMATKAAADILVRSAALEFGKRGIRINSIAPGPTEDTPMAAAVVTNKETMARLRQTTPLGRIGTANDVAETALWLASGRAFITGEVLQVNGGRAIPTV